ncbi:hypothetical protein GCM10023178_10490 [Actinomadura luteofluorescens]
MGATEKTLVVWPGGVVIEAADGTEGSETADGGFLGRGVDSDLGRALGVARDRVMRSVAES